MNELFICLTLFLLASCGQTGKLYLTDQQIIAHSSNPNQIKKISARIKLQQQLKIAKLQTNKNSAATNLQILEIQYQLGQLKLQQQLAGSNQ